MTGESLLDFSEAPDHIDCRFLYPVLALLYEARSAVVFVDGVEIDLHAVHEDDGGTDLMIEVKDWVKEPTLDVIRRFVEVKEALTGHLEKKTVFLFYNESGLSDEAAARLHEAGIPVLDPEKLAGFEASLGL